VLGKGSNEEDAANKLLDAESGDETGNLKQMIAMYAGGLNGGEKQAAISEGDSNYAVQVLKELGESEDASECFLCSSEIFDEVLLPCYHRG
jgi:DNA repair protein RAD5